MKTKARFVGGPAGGKSIELGSNYGANEVIMTTPKRMTRKQKWDLMASARSYDDPITVGVTATYRLAMRVFGNGNNFITAPCQHPDGSLFYEYVEGSKREW